MIRRPAFFLATLSFLAIEAAAFAQSVPVVAPPPPVTAEAGHQVEFQADTLSYAENADVITATGNVQVRRGDEELTADTVIYNRATGMVTAEGNVLGQSAGGEKIVAERVELNESLRDGVIENLLLILADQSRLAANVGTRRDGVSTLDHAVYSPCAVIDDDTGCPQEPVWSIKAVRIVHDPVRKRVFYKHARLEIFGVPILVLPRMSHPDSFDENQSGILSPDVSYSRELGGELSIPYFWSISPSQNLTATAHIYTDVNPVLGLEYNHLLKGDPIRVAARMTHGRGEEIDPITGDIIETPAKFRGYFEANGQLSHGDTWGGGWRSTFSTRLTTDDNFPGRYQISLDDTLRTTYALERFRDDSYISIGGWFFQGLGPDDDSARTPLALPLIDARWRPDVNILDGRLLVVANTVGIYRREGQRMARALASAQWDRSFLTPMGQRITVTGLVRGDLYSVDNSALADDPLYAGRDGFRGRVIPLAAVDIEWPFAGPLGGGMQEFSPRVQLVTSTTTANESIPNEDSRAIDLEESNLFALNRFSGFDRWEGGARITYGLTWKWRKPGLAIGAQIGQSYRLDNQEEIFPDGTGLNRRMSDIVSRMSVRVGPYVEVVQRLRLDKDSLAIRRNETDVSIGSNRTFFTLGYARYNRNINLEDLVDHEEVRAGARLAFGRYWAVYGSTILDITSRQDETDQIHDGYQPIRHRVGIVYTDECFDFSVTWRRNYVDNPNARRGNTFLFSIALRNLGTRN